MVTQKTITNEGSLNDSGNEARRQIKVKSILRESEEKETAATARSTGYNYLDLSISPIDSDALKIIPLEDAKKTMLAIIQKIGKKIQIVAYNPESNEAREAINKLEEKGYVCSIVMVSKSSLERAWSNYDTISDNGPKAEQTLNLSAQELSDFEKSIADLAKFAEKITASPVSETLNIIMAGAVKTQSSDVHLEPTANDVRLRYRVDGILQDMAVFPKKTYLSLLNRVKMLGRLKLNVSGVPQNGRFSVTVGAEMIDIRLALLPGVYGEDIVMRLLYQNAKALEMTNLGLRPEMLETIKHELSKPNGMVLVTGPTGSGKTTTLYGFVNHLNTPGTKIITIEDPVEYKISGVSQTSVSTDQGYTFATGLAAILRQDPDIIMVGEIREPDTASIAVQAALTGHLVFSTLHTNDAPGAIPRLTELGVRPSLLPPAINVIIAQRLVRKLCPFCKEKYTPTPEIIDQINRALSSISPKSKIKPPEKVEFLWKEKGCAKCNLGFKGRIGIFEIFTITPAIEKLVLEMGSASEINKVACEEGMITIIQDGLLKVIEGITSLAEVEKIAGEMGE